MVELKLNLPGFHDLSRENQEITQKALELSYETIYSAIRESLRARVEVFAELVKSNHIGILQEASKPITKFPSVFDYD